MWFTQVWYSKLSNKKTEWGAVVQILKGNPLNEETFLRKWHLGLGLKEEWALIECSGGENNSWSAKHCQALETGLILEKPSLVEKFYIDLQF